LFKELLGLFPEEALKILLVLSLSFLIGLEREEHKAKGTSYTFGGVRTFPLIGLIGYMTAFLTNLSPIGVGVGFAVVGSFLLVSYLHKLSMTGDAGVTTEVSGLLTYLLGPLVYSGKFWIATAIVVVAALLLELKQGLENLTNKIDSDEVVTFTKFLLVTFVILPIVPNQGFTFLNINPFKTWLVVVAVSTVSYGSYVVNKLAKGKGGPLLTAILGGAYSSTVTTIVLARRSKDEVMPRYFSGSILTASGIMYLRIFLLIFVFNASLAMRLFWPMIILFVIGFAGGILWTRIPDGEKHEIERKYSPKNPLALRSALFFAMVFLIILIATELVVRFVSAQLIYPLAAIMGLSDVDPFIMSLTQTSGAGKALFLDTAARAIIIATSSNNVIKGVYASIFGEKRTGNQSFYLLLGLALLGMAFLFFI
jgi:uncharacterized membrane protein (DUF4010 family)